MSYWIIKSARGKCSHAAKVAKTIRIGNRNVVTCWASDQNTSGYWLRFVWARTLEISFPRYSLAPRIKRRISTQFSPNPCRTRVQTHAREFQREDIFRIERNKKGGGGETRNNERIPFTFTFQISNAKYWNAIVGRRAVNREGNGSKICDKRVHVNATRYARRPQICGGPLLYPGPGYIGMCKVFPRASDLQGFSKINGYAWSSCLGDGEGRRRRNSSGVATVLHSLWTTRTRPIRRPDGERLGPLLH